MASASAASAVRISVVATVTGAYHYVLAIAAKVPRGAELAFRQPSIETERSLLHDAQLPSVRMRRIDDEVAFRRDDGRRQPEHARSRAVQPGVPELLQRSRRGVPSPRSRELAHVELVHARTSRLASASDSEA
jgi:hypothetical protein